MLYSTGVLYFPLLLFYWVRSTVQNGLTDSPATIRRRFCLSSSLVDLLMRDMAFMRD